MVESPSRIAQVACPHDCPDACLMDVVVKDGRAVKVTGNRQHPYTRGALCAKVSRLLERVYAPERLLHPVRRVGPKGPGGTFRPISWEEAISDIVGRIRQAITEHGAQSVLPYSYRGNNGVYQSNGIDRRFFHALGASKLARTICTGGLQGALAYSDVFRGFPPEGLVESRLILFWAANPVETGLHLWPYVMEAKRRGATLIAIDPYRSRTARSCDRHIFIRPGTDAALALAMAKVIEAEGLVDHDYVRQYTVGYELFAQRLRSLSMGELSQACGIPAEVIGELARTYATTRPSAIRVGLGLQRSGGGAAAVKVVACLPVLTGAWRHVGGGLSTTYGRAMHEAQDQDRAMRPDLAPADTRVVNMARLAEHLLDPAFHPPIKVIYVYNSNPAASLPDQRRVRKALQRPDLFTVLHDMFLTDTADYADIVLPATSPLEHEDFVLAYGGDFGSFSPRALPPQGEARSNAEVFQLLAKALGVEEAALGVSAADMAAEALRDGVRVEEFISKPFVRTRNQPDLRPRALGGFNTPSGKFEFYCERMAQDGLDPLPAFVPPHETLGSSPYPLNFVSRKHRDSLNSSYTHLPIMARQEEARRLEMHPVDAESRGLKDSDEVRVFNDRGEFVTRLRVSTNVPPGTVAAFWGWWDKLSGGKGNVNNVTSSALTDLGGGPTFYDCRVGVERLQGKALA
ncbi:MAG: molybdopterin-dependent oxidoreductase [Chloroflexi bacterium]|nr:molybdopterin-dependent oxidoreductase [Chloroflexota bacterium]